MFTLRHARSGSWAATTALIWAVCSTSTWATILDDIGVTPLRALVPTLTGTGVLVAQPEATTLTTNPYYDYDDFEIDPAAAGVSIPITYVNSIGGVVSFAPAYTSSHAITIASLLAGANTGVAPHLAGILNYNANEYINYVVANYTIPQNPQIINQSFIIGPQGPYTANVLNQCWDSFVAVQGVIIVSLAGDAGAIQLPATAYNVITVGAYGGASSVSQPGQLAKPDITAPAGATSYSTPLVTGAAALLVQAATIANNSAGGDPRVVKALLLNGAVKPGDWTHDSADPLDRRYGAGVLNVYNSYQNFQAGQQARTSYTRTTSLGGSHAPSNATTGFVGAIGWNLATLASSGSGDGVDHYVIDLRQNPVGVPLILTATLTWQRAQDAALTSEIINSSDTTSAFTSATNTINNLDLYLYDANTQALLGQSVSSIDNVEHLYTLNLAPDKFDLQVLKNGGAVGSSNVFSDSEIYGLAWSAASITAVKSVTNKMTLTFSQTGSITVPATILGTGTLTQSGVGTTNVTGAANYSGPTVISAGKLSFGGGVSHSIAGVLGTGSMVVAAATILTSDGVNMPTGSLTIAGAQTIRSSAGSGAYQQFATGHSASALTGTSKISGAGLTVTGALDIKDNALIVEAANSANKTTLLATLAGKLGTMITSTTATTNSHYTMDVIDNGKLGASMFGGLPVDANSIIVTEALKGDGNMDGNVGVADLTIWKANFGNSGVYATNFGDFNHDGIVSAADLSLWKSNFGANITTYPTPSDASTGGLITPPTAAYGTGLSNVPEPASLAFFASSAVLLLMRRRSRK